jgi:thiol-disulfide isomerase/thioredoxin
LFLWLESKWTSPPEAIAARRAELKRKFPDMDPTPQRFPQLKPVSTGTIEYAFDRRRLRFLRDELGQRGLEIWDGRQGMAHYKYFTHQQETYVLFNTTEKIGGRFLLGMPWPRSQAHTFWWTPLPAKEFWEDFSGHLEDFVITGRAGYRGVDCYVLENKNILGGRTRKWYVGVKDRLLYGNLLSTQTGRPEGESWTLDYREIAPGCWFPMTQGSERYEDNADGESCLQHRHNLKVLEVRVNEKLPDKLFQIEFEEGVEVADHRFGGLVTYPYKADRTDEQWQEIRERARKRADSDTEDNRARDALIGKPAPPFPENAEWLNSKPLTWEQLRGRVVILVFWAKWCGPCRNDFPYMSDLHKKSKQSAISVIGIHTLGSKIKDIKNVMKKYDLHCPVCINTPSPPDGKGFGAMSSRYGVEGIPYAFVVDKQGNVAGRAGHVEYIIALVDELVEK